MKVRGFVGCNEGNFYFFSTLLKVYIVFDDLATVFDRNWRYVCKLCEQHFVNLVMD